VRLFKNTWFDRFAKKEDITDEELRNAVNRLEAGDWDADLGGYVFKQRIAREGEGKSGGYRVLVFFKSGERTFFVYGFPKSNMGNIKQSQLADFKKAAKVAMKYSDEQLNERLKTGLYIEF
jgi:hypothetical protein